MSSAPGPSRPPVQNGAAPQLLPPGRSLLLLPQKAGAAQMSQTPVTALVAPCRQSAPIDPVVLEHLTVWDPEDGGDRHWDEKTQTLHIVQKAALDHVRITYTGPDVPKSLTVWRNGELLRDLPGGGDWTAEVTYATPMDPYDTDVGEGNPLQSPFTASSPVCIYSFVAPQFTVTVRVYNPDQWKLKLTVPPMKGQSFSRKGQFDSAARTYSSDSASWEVVDGALRAKSVAATIKTSADGKRAEMTTARTRTHLSPGAVTTTTEERDRSYTAAGSQLVDVGWKDGQYSIGAGGRTIIEGKGQSKSRLDGLAALGGMAGSDLVSLACNGRPVRIEVLAFIGSALFLMLCFQRLRDAIRNLVPQIGWFWDVDWKVLEGTFETDWGWRENKDGGVHFAIGLQAQMTLVEAKGQIGIGISSKGFKGQALLELSGEVPLRAGPLRLNVPAEGGNTPSVDLASVSGEIKATCKILCQAGWVAKIEGGFKSTLLSAEGAIKMGGDAGLRIEADTRFEGVKIFYTYSFFMIQNRAEAELMGPVPIGKITFPRKADLHGDELSSRAEVEEAVDVILSEGWFPITFYMVHSYQKPAKEYGLFGDVIPKTKTVDVTIPTRQVAGEVAAKIWERHARLDLRRGTVEGIVLGLRDVLRAEGQRVSVDRLRAVVNSAAFADTLTRAECPVKCCLLDHGLAAQ